MEREKKELLIHVTNTGRPWSSLTLSCLLAVLTTRAGPAQRTKRSFKFHEPGKFQQLAQKLRAKVRVRAGKRVQSWIMSLTSKLTKAVDYLTPHIS